MKIAILSMQEVKNYGSFLQAFSLKKNIEALGHSCDFINIIPGRQLEGYKTSRFHKLNLLFKRLWGVDFVKRFKVIYKFQTRFAKEFLPYLGVKNGADADHYDIVVIGSDEVFNCAQRTWFGFSPQLFGHGINADKIVSYAASFGATTLEKLESMGIKDEVAGYLGNISAISVRDKNSFDVVQGLIGKTPMMNVDPVLIFDYSKYMPVRVDMKDFMIVYTYPGRITDKDEIISIRGVAKSRGLKLVSIGHYFPWCDEVIVPTPFEVLAYFRDAACIVTDTFHGSIFSLKYNKPFCTIVRAMNSNKLTFLLEQFGLDGRIVRKAADISSTMDVPIDYKSVNQKIAEEKERSLNYLKREVGVVQ